MILNQIRKIAFYTLDFLQGLPVKKSINEIEKINLLSFDDKRLKKYQNEKINNILKIAKKTNNYYKQYYDKKFAEMPILNKNILKQKGNQIISEGYEKNKLYKMSTSGSTGTPFVCYQNKEKKKRVQAEIISYSKELGYDVGNKLIYLRALSTRCKKSELKQFIQNQNLIDCADLSENGIKTILKKLSNLTKKESAMLLAYGSTYNAIKDYAEKNHVKIRISGAVSGSDMLFDNTRNKIKEMFHCKCISRYSNEENGVIGQDLDNGMNNMFLINEADYFIEILDMDKDIPVPYGKIGRIVITDFFNYAMPFIRYDTGDVGAIEIFEINGVQKRFITQFGGRKTDNIYKPNGERIASNSISTLMWEFNNIKQFQFIQTGQKEYRLLLNIEKPFKDENRIYLKIKALLGEEAKIEVEYIKEIPVLASGKRRYIVNEWKK